MMNSYPAHGWLPPGASFQKKWDDQGVDFATNWDGRILSPGKWKCVQIGHDVPFPNGFGPNYAYIEQLDGPWTQRAPDNSNVFYIGHNDTHVHQGQTGEAGAWLASADQGHNWAGTIGGWVELGNAYWNPNYGMWLPGPKLNHHWFDTLINTPLVRCELPYKFNDEGWPIIGLTSNLTTCGYMGHYENKFDQQVHGAVVAFRKQHGIYRAPNKKGGDGGTVDAAMDRLLQQRSDWCKKHGPEYRA